MLAGDKAFDTGQEEHGEAGYCRRLVRTGAVSLHFLFQPRILKAIAKNLQDIFLQSERQQAFLPRRGHVLQGRDSGAGGRGGRPCGHAPAGCSQRRARLMLGARQHVVVAVR